MAKVKVDVGTLFERHENKYSMNPGTYRELAARLAPYMEQDEYGLHTIHTIYYDTEDYAIIRHSLDKPSFKVKLRLRSYGTPREGDTVYLELKKKLGGVTYKRRIPLPLWQARAYLEQGATPPAAACDPQTFGEIDWFVREKQPAPKVLLSYDRIALRGRQDENFRMTFDANVRWRDDRLDLAQGEGGSLLFKPGTRLLEVKTLGALPLWLCQILSELEIYPLSLSKYGAVYTGHLANSQAEVVLSA